jgi:hypothetical protein
VRPRPALLTNSEPTELLVNPRHHLFLAGEAVGPNLLGADNDRGSDDASFGIRADIYARVGPGTAVIAGKSASIRGRVDDRPPETQVWKSYRSAIGRVAEGALRAEQHGQPCSTFHVQAALEVDLREQP